MSATEVAFGRGARIGESVSASTLSCVSANASYDRAEHYAVGAAYERRFRDLCMSSAYRICCGLTIRITGALRSGAMRVPSSCMTQRRSAPIDDRGRMVEKQLAETETEHYEQSEELRDDIKAQLKKWGRRSSRSSLDRASRKLFRSFVGTSRQSSPPWSQSSRG